MPRWTTFRAFLDDVSRADRDARQALVDLLLKERPRFPWVEAAQATFVYSGDVKAVALNLDTIPRDPPFEPMTRIDGTNLWYVTQPFAPDDLLDYMLAVDDPMTPLAQETDIAGRVSKYWKADPLNTLKMDTPQMNVSVLRMNAARPFPDWSSLHAVPNGRVFEHPINSEGMVGRGVRKLWVYNPPGYDGSGMMYPLLIVQDGQWMIGPLQLPFIADALIKHRRMVPVVIAMIQSASQEDRNQEYISSDKYYNFLLSELMPFVQTHYRIDSNRVGIGGVAVGAVAAAHAALKNPAVFSRLMMVSPPLGKGEYEEELRDYAKRFAGAEKLPERIFQSVGRYEAKARFQRPAFNLKSILDGFTTTEYQFVETGSGHGLVGFRSVLPEALAWTFPGDAFA